MLVVTPAIFSLIDLQGEHSEVSERFSAAVLRILQPIVKCSYGSKGSDFWLVSEEIARF
jgi:hypothetical protein